MDVRVSRRHPHGYGASAFASLREAVCLAAQARSPAGVFGRFDPARSRGAFPRSFHHFGEMSHHSGDMRNPLASKRLCATREVPWRGTCSVATQVYGRKSHATTGLKLSASLFTKVVRDPQWSPWARRAGQAAQGRLLSTFLPSFSSLNPQSSVAACSLRSAGQVARPVSRAKDSSERILNKE